MRSGTCGITKKPCKWAARCLYAEGAGCAHAHRGGSPRKRPLDMCAVAAENGFGGCKDCPERARCAEAWRCWRAEQMETRGNRVERLLRVAAGGEP